MQIWVGLSMERKKLAAPETKTQRDCISSGCTLLDCVLGGGYAQGRVVNIVGDKSTGKTLLAIEACANFAHRQPKGKIYYNEVEAAFDVDYAASLGLPTDRVEFVDDCSTVEDFFEHLTKIIEETPKDQPALYIVDSLDALSDTAEMERGIDEGSFGASKAKKLSQIFRRLIQELEGKKITLMIISQERDNIGVTFGKKSTRSGGRALDFYCSQVLWLSQLKQLKKVKKGVERPIGIMVKAKCEKNKVGLPFRDCEFPLIFGFGVDDITAGLDWLKETDNLAALELTEKTFDAMKKGLFGLPNDEYHEFRKKVSKAVRTCWDEIEEGFTPLRKKYA